MDYIDRIVKKVIKESVDQYKLSDAINRRYEVEINYMPDKSGKGGGTRTIQPVAYGLSNGKNHNLVLRAFQPYGDTKTKVPHWKMFRIDKITSWKPKRNRKFGEPPGMFKADGEYNASGDKSMASVYNLADFVGTQKRYLRGGLKRYNDERTRKRQEEDPYYKIRKNIEKSIDPKNYPDILKNIEFSKREEEERRRALGPNTNSADEMAWSNAFDTGRETSTVGPIIKGKSNQNVPQEESSNSEDYGNVYKNGPVYKKSKKKNYRRFDKTTDMNFDEEDYNDEDTDIED